VTDALDICIILSCLKFFSNILEKFEDENGEDEIQKKIKEDYGIKILERLEKSSDATEEKAREEEKRTEENIINNQNTKNILESLEVLEEKLTDQCYPPSYMNKRNKMKIDFFLEENQKSEITSDEEEHENTKKELKLRKSEAIRNLEMKLKDIEAEMKNQQKEIKANKDEAARKLEERVTNIKIEMKNQQKEINAYKDEAARKLEERVKEIKNEIEIQRKNIEANNIETAEKLKKKIRKVKDKLKKQQEEIEAIKAKAIKKLEEKESEGTTIKSNIFEMYDFDYKKVFNDCLSIESLNQTFNSEKANYALEVYKMLTSRKMDKIEIDESAFKKLKIFNDNKLQESLNIILSYIRGEFNDTFILFKCFKIVATRSDNGIEKLVDENGFKDIQIESSEKKNWKDLIEELNKHKKWKIFGLEHLENLIEVCKLNQNKEDEFSKIDERELMKEQFRKNNIKKIEVIITRYISSISNSFQNKDEINKFAAKGDFFSVLEILNNSLYTEDYILFNKQLIEIIETKENDNLIDKMNTVEAMASKNKISTNIRYITFKKLIDEINNLKCKFKVL
jgi:hypothetical protein